MTETILAFIPSPSQGVWHIGPVPIRAYALCIIAGIIAALIIGDRRWVARGGEQGVIYDIALLAVPFGLVGGRLYHVMTDWKTYFGEGGAGLGAAFRIWDGGLGIWGAVALGAVGAWVGCRMRGIPLPAFGDAVAPGIILAQAIGRLGNYFNQELYGRATTLPWGLEIYERRDASGALNTLNGVSDGQLVGVVHPTFLYELLWNLLIFALLLWIDKRFNLGHGRLFALYVAGYCVGRFWIELMRSDPASMPVDGIRVNTFTSTFVFVAAVVYIMVAPKGRDDPETLRGKQDDDSPVDDLLAKELAVVGAGTGVVAAATVAGAAEADDAAAVGDAGDADVAEEAEAADEAEEPVDADTLEVGEPDEAEASEAEPSEVSAELEAASESLAAAESSEPSGDDDAPEVEVAEESSGDEAAEGAVEADVPEESAEAPAEGDAPEESDESPAEAEPAEDTAVEEVTDGASEDAAEAPAEGDAPEESDESPADAEPAGVVEEPAVAEVTGGVSEESAEAPAEGDAPEESDESPAEAESADVSAEPEVASESVAGAESSEPEADVATEASDESEETADQEPTEVSEEPAAEDEVAEPESDESAEDSDAAPEVPAATPPVTPSPAAPANPVKRWWRRNR